MNQISTEDFFNILEKVAVLKTILSFEFDITFLALKRFLITITEYVMMH